MRSPRQPLRRRRHRYCPFLVPTVAVRRCSPRALRKGARARARALTWRKIVIGWYFQGASVSYADGADSPREHRRSVDADTPPGSGGRAQGRGRGSPSCHIMLSPPGKETQTNQTHTRPRNTYKTKKQRLHTRNNDFHTQTVRHAGRQKGTARTHTHTQGESQAGDT